MNNPYRRKFLKLLAIGGGMGILVKFFGSDLLNLAVGQTEDTVNKRNLGQFQIEQDGESLSIYSSEGKELFIIDNEK